MIEIERVTFGYRGDRKDTDGQEEPVSGADAQLYDVSLQVRSGECILLCGESGCGKTTVTRLINGLIPYYSEGCKLEGTVKAAGLNVADTQLYELARHIGSVFQNPKSQFFSLDTDSELAFGLENQGMPPKQMEERLVETTGTLELEGLLGRDIFSLSGGEKQTLAFASVYAMNPEIYVLDEPTANLDEEAIERLRRQIAYLKQTGRTVVIAEHRLYFLTDIIDRAVYIVKGSISRCFSGKEFQNLTEKERISMGLRAIHSSKLDLPKASSHLGGRGLVVKGLTCGYKKEPPIFENLSFAADKGEVLAIMGPNGVGKTTLIRTLSGLVKEQSGEILLHGRKMKAGERRRASFCVMQDVNHQLFYDSVRNECRQAAGEDGEQIDKVLEEFDLLELAERHPMSLSGGQKQRLAVTTALLSGKEVLIFDEPTSGLDYRHMKEVSKVVRRLSREGHIILVVSHDKEFMQETCDRILVLKKK